VDADSGARGGSDVAVDLEPPSAFYESAGGPAHSSSRLVGWSISTPFDLAPA